jgi:endonuclease YncB( thermonuclease family)
MDIKTQLKSSTLQTVPVFSLKGVVTYAKLVRNYDGDTGDIVLIYKDTLMRFRARFSGYDCCEMKPPLSDPQRDTKKKRAILAKQRLWTLCTSSTDPECKEQHTNLIKVKCEDFDKYGRLLVVAFNEDCDFEGMDESTIFKHSINNKMIEEGHAYSYEGGTKHDF